MLSFLAENDKWTDFSVEVLYDFSLKITSHPSKDHETHLAEIAATIKKRLVNF